MKSLIKNLNKEKTKIPPIWMMRQAGRYLPEYREIRSRASNFLELCYNPKLASEITLQPIRRFGFDGAILFSDILVIPDALGIKVEFLKGEGPKLEAISSKKDLIKFNPQKLDKLNPVYETIALTKSKLDANTALIGFSGSPWTIATYIIEGGGSKNFEKVRGIAISDENFFSGLIEILVESITLYLSNQIEAGAEVIKLFDSWAGVLPEDEYRKWVLEPNRKIIERLKGKFPKIPIILFARGSGLFYEDLIKETKADCFAIDQNLPKKWANEILQKKHNAVIQGNLDNIILADGSLELLEQEVKSIIKTFGDYPFIFNLGHGVLPHTKIENIQKVIEVIRKNGIIDKSW